MSTAVTPPVVKTSSVIEPPGSKDGLRETIESVVIAFVLAFLFRTFEAEAFVIPTGSMAPTLMGRHCDTTCPQCGYPVQAGVHESLDGLRTLVCPNCRYEADYSSAQFDPREGRTVTGRDSHLNPRVYSGDRIIVSKFPYEVSDPKRWDVAVFRYPATANTNYIKRIVGLPRETLRIFNGDVYTRPAGQTDFVIARKPPEKVLAMMQVVYDNDYPLALLEKQGWPLRWQPDASTDGAAWAPSDDRRTYAVDAQGKPLTWLRYHHLVPTPESWEAIRGGLPAADVHEIAEEAGRQLINDYYAYNSHSPTNIQHRGYDADFLGRHWVGDLALECAVTVREGTEQLTLELVEGGRRHQCRFDLKQGAATLAIDGLDAFAPRAETTIRGPGTHRLRMANVDDQLLVWVDDRLLSFDQPTTYSGLPFSRPGTIPQANHRGDFSPLGIGVAGGAAEVTHLRVLRDVYYIADRGQGPYGTISESSDIDPLPRFIYGGDFPTPVPVDYELQADEFFALGDNSPKSKDSRLWTGVLADGRSEHFVRRELLIGKAMFIYWPHYWAPDWAVTLRLSRAFSIEVPFWPNVQRMKFVH